VGFFGDSGEIGEDGGLQFAFLAELFHRGGDVYEGVKAEGYY
jgi:hypothetical protein